MRAFSVRRRSALYEHAVVKLSGFVWICVSSSSVQAATETPDLLGIPVDFILFALTLLGVAAFHRYTLQVALAGLAVITAYKLAFTEFPAGRGLAGLVAHLQHEWVLLANLLCLLVGFALLSRHFEDSHVPEVLPRFLPADWKGGFVLLFLIWLMSGFLDNIAGALIGATVAGIVFRHKVHPGYLAAIVAAANAGGAGSVVGDTTTTMMWLAGISPFALLPAYLAAAVALVVFGVPASLQQQRYAPIMKSEARDAALDWARVGIVVLILLAAVASNVTVNLHFKHLADVFPFIGVAVWIVLLVCAPVRQPEWKLVPEALKGTIFLLALVTSASMMPVEKLPPASWESTFALGFVSAVFDNIPLTALGLKQGGYDWAMLAYAVGFGGSMIWFGSSAGVAVSNIYPEAKSVWKWLRHGWHIPVGYVLGYLTMLWLLGWNPR
jgi:Na+/H+ antiporter NhaD/arsenite permease-like protein